MHLTTHGNLLAISDPDKGVVVIVAHGPVTEQDWNAAIAAHQISALYTDWDYSETDGHAVWLLTTDPIKVGA